MSKKLSINKTYIYYNSNVHYKVHRNYDRVDPHDPYHV